MTPPHRRPAAGGRRNIAAHYDLGNDCFSLFLDETLACSCAIFPSAERTLLEASVAKFDRICRTLELKSTDHSIPVRIVSPLPPDMRPARAHHTRVRTP